MLSRLSITLDFENGNEPVIEVLHEPSTDVKDSIVKSFLERLGGSSWCRITFKDAGREKQKAVISAINSADLKEQAQIMLEQARLNEDFQERLVR